MSVLKNKLKNVEILLQKLHDRLPKVLEVWDERAEDGKLYHHWDKNLHFTLEELNEYQRDRKDTVHLIVIYEKSPVTNPPPANTLLYIPDNGRENVNRA